VLFIARGKSMLSLLQVFIRRFLFALLCLQSASVVWAAESETRLLTHLKLKNVTELKVGDPSQSTEGFEIDPSLGRVWVAYYVLGALQDESHIGGIGLSALPDGVPVSISNATLTFNSPNMAIPDVQPGTGLTVKVNGTPIAFDEADLRHMLGDEAANAALARPEALRHVVQLRRYDIPDDTPTAMLVEVLRIDNMQPLAIELVVGQGAIPKDLEAFEQAINGNWFVRNRVPSLIIGTILLAGLWLMRRLRR
jgi:hypothetical protein